MLISNLQYFQLFIITSFIVGLVTPIMRKIAVKKRILDFPTSAHKSHTKAIPYLGGLAILIGVVTVSYSALFFSNSTFSNFWLATSVLGPAIAMGFVGLWDDIKNLPPLLRFIAQSLSGIFISIVLIVNSSIANPTGSTFLDILLTVFWVVGISNSINFFDNLDGGAAGTAAISAIFITYLAIKSDQTFVSALSVVVAGATLGFLAWNKSPAKIYMGDAGALFLGVLLATLTIRLKPSVETTLGSFSIPVLILAIPILDTCIAVFSRLRRGVSPFQGGKDHLSHRLVRVGMSRKIAALVLWLLSALFGLFAVVITLVSKESEPFFVFGFMLLWIVLFFGFFRTSDN